MKVTLCEKCPYTPMDLTDHYEADAAIHLCARCDSEPSRNGKGLSELCERFWTLTPREQQVMALLCDRRQLKEIAEKLGARVHTIRVHSSRIRSKMCVQSVPDLMRISVKLGSAPQKPMTACTHDIASFHDEGSEVRRRPRDTSTEVYGFPSRRFVSLEER
jgi:DNA-binding CsgD family transcriptional regulator